MPTRIDQEQVSGLTGSISGLESTDISIDTRIDYEDSINDSVDVSLDQRIDYEDSINDSVDVSLDQRIDYEDSINDAVDASLQSQITSLSSSLGTSGTSGTNGANGTSGVDGTSGIDGTSGSNGTSGNSGTSGTNGANGTSGTSGTNGANGTSGVDGTSGVSGASGTSGLTGTSGATGATGPAGPSFETIQSVTDGTIVNGPTSETISKTASIPAGTYATGDIIDLVFRVKKTTNFSNVNIRAYIGTSATTTSGSNQIATGNLSLNDKFCQISRLIAVVNDTTNSELFDRNFTLNDDMTNSTSYNNLSIDWTVQNYLLITLQNNSFNESSVASMYRIFKT
jgi:hypothetical protein